MAAVLLSWLRYWWDKGRCGNHEEAVFPYIAPPKISDSCTVVMIKKRYTSLLQCWFGLYHILMAVIEDLPPAQRGVTGLHFVSTMQ